MSVTAVKKLFSGINKASTFFVPSTHLVKKSSVAHLSHECAAVIPTYKPSITTYHLVKTLSGWFPTMKVIVVDDCTPLTDKQFATVNKLQNLARASRNIIYLRTPVNALKAGALNFGIKHLMGFKKAPQVVFTFDDDVQINQQTLPLLINGLYSTKRTGAVCSMAIVKNKHTNLLTRLQALEYLSFNISKIADNGFLQGPLVMQGMLTAFRMSALRQVRGFTEGHLIEDYDITAKLKYLGWNVRLIFQAKAWTTVPEDLESLWKQRVRWTYGGMGVVSDYWRMPAVVFQDLLGHTVFLSLVFLILTSFLLPRVSFQSPLLVVLIFSLSIINFIQAFLFSILIIFKLPGWEKQDLLLRLSILPEFIYCNFLSLILIGSYLFFVFNFLMSKIVTNLLPAEPVYHLGLKAFKRIGYSTSWGTRQA